MAKLSVICYIWQSRSLDFLFSFIFLFEIIIVIFGIFVTIQTEWSTPQFAFPPPMNHCPMKGVCNLFA